LLKPKIGKIKEKKASELLENARERKSETPSPEHTEITLKSSNAERDFEVSVFPHFSGKQTANPRSKKKERFYSTDNQNRRSPARGWTATIRGIQKKNSGSD